MQISKTFLIACGTAYCLALLPLCAADADTDLKLREALEKKINELQTQPPAPTQQPNKPSAPAPTPAPAARPTPPAQWAPTLPAQPAQRMAQPLPAAPAQPVPAIAQPAPVPAPAPAPIAQPTAKPVLVAPTPVDPEAIAKAREALRQKMNELDMQSAVTGPTPAPATQSKAGFVANAPAPANAESAAKARAAMEHEMNQLQGMSPVAAGGAAATPAPGSTKPNKRDQLLREFPPLQAPPPAVALDKEQRLQELLRQYKADLITPEQYHQQRAKILGEP